MKNHIEPIARLIRQFGRLPGVGAKMAQRYAYSVIGMTTEDVDEFCQALKAVKNEVKHCEVCGNFSATDTCEICLKRDRSIICVVSDPKDIIALERVKSFGGVYHVLFGTLSPIDNRGPDDIRLKELVTRISSGEVREVIVATNPDVEGEATAAYIARLLKPFEINVTRIAQGISLGSQLEYADEVTLTRALEDRKKI